MLTYERLARWAVGVWGRRNPGKSYVCVWAQPGPSNQLAHARVKPGRHLKGKTVYRGVESIACPVVASVSATQASARQVHLTETTGAFVFSFEADEPFEVLYVSAHFHEHNRDRLAIALVPPGRLLTWHAFEEVCREAARGLRRRREVYVVGGSNASFKPTVKWDDVILPRQLKDDLLRDVNTFFEQGVGLYRQLNLPPFRKLLLSGPPGTGKTMLCSALAKLSLRKRRVVVYVSGSDQNGPTFLKIHHALEVVARSRMPVLLIVEELDAFLHKNDKARILNVLDGLESPNNPKGALLLATTNYPEIIDERILKRPGRLDRVFLIPPIQDREQALAMLERYMGEQWQADHAVLAEDLIGQTGAFVRELALQARMMAAHNAEAEVSLDMLQAAYEVLTDQMEASDAILEGTPLEKVTQGARSPNGRRLGFPAR